MESLFSSQLFLLSLTLLAFVGAQWLRKRVNSLLLNPIIVSAVVIIAVLHFLDIDYELYNRANEPINFMLGISVVALGYLMYKNSGTIKTYKFSIISATFLGSLIGLLSVILITYLFGCDEVISISLQPKSVTTPIALSLSKSLGGVAALTALSVVVTGIFGSVVGPWILTLCKVTDPVARGVALGSASHAIGTSRALELGALEGAVGGASIGLMGLFTSFLAPLINSLL